MGFDSANRPLSHRDIKITLHVLQDAGLIHWRGSFSGSFPLFTIGASGEVIAADDDLVLVRLRTDRSAEEKWDGRVASLELVVPTSLDDPESCELTFSDTHQAFSTGYWLRSIEVNDAGERGVSGHS